MPQHQPTDPHKPEPTPAESLTHEQAKQLSDKQKQAEYQQAYLEQLRQQQCPGCGESELF